MKKSTVGLLIIAWVALVILGSMIGLTLGRAVPIIREVTR